MKNRKAAYVKLLNVKADNNAWKRTIDNLIKDEPEEVKKLTTMPAMLHSFIRDFEAVESTIRTITKRPVLLLNNIDGGVSWRQTV